MKTAEEIAQWVIDNRYPKSELDKVSDQELYHGMVDAINGLTNQSKWISVETKPEVNKQDTCVKVLISFANLDNNEDSVEAALFWKEPFHFSWADGDDIGYHIKITGWQYLPAPITNPTKP